MTTCYGKPIHYGKITLQTEWENGRGLTYANCRAVVKQDGEVVAVFPFAELRKAMDFAIALSLPSKKGKA